MCVELAKVVQTCIYLFGVLRRFQHCTGHITMGSWKGRGSQYIEFTRVVYCKLPTNGKQLQTCRTSVINYGIISFIEFLKIWGLSPFFSSHNHVVFTF